MRLQAGRSRKPVHSPAAPPRPSSPRPERWSPGHLIVEFPGALGWFSVCWQNLSLEDSQGLGMRALLVSGFGVYPASAEVVRGRRAGE